MCVWGMESQSCSNSQLSRWFAGVTGLVRPETPRAFLAVWGRTPVALPFQNMPGRAGKETLHTSYSFKDSWQREKKANVRLPPPIHTLSSPLFFIPLGVSLYPALISLYFPRAEMANILFIICHCLWFLSECRATTTAACRIIFFLLQQASSLSNTRATWFGKPQQSASVCLG